MIRYCINCVFEDKSDNHWACRKCLDAPIFDFPGYKSKRAAKKKKVAPTATNSRLRKCPHCGKAIKAGTSKSGKRCAKGARK